MIKNFLYEVLKLDNYNVIQHKTGKDNLTYEIQVSDGNSFIIQQLSSIKSARNIRFIEEIIQHINEGKGNILFANSLSYNRFFDYHGVQFQVMEKLAGLSIVEKDINTQLIIKSAEYLATFHNQTINFNVTGYSEINYHKKMHQYKEIAKKYILYSKNIQINNVFGKMELYSRDLNENFNLPRGVIHGDPSFKNFLIDIDNNIVGLIDYDMLSVNTILWDLADMVRSYLKIDLFNKKAFKILVESYNKIHPLSKQERSHLKTYCYMMVLDTGFRYIISYFEDTNLIGGKEDCLQKSQRCLNELKKLDTFFI